MKDIYSILPDYYKQKIAVVGKWRYFDLFRDALVDCIRQFGFESDSFYNFEDAYSYNPTCIVVIAPQYYEIPKRHDIIWIMIQVEQLFNDDKKTEQKMFKGYLDQLIPRFKTYDIILDICKSNIYGLKNLCNGVVEFFPFYWHPSFGGEKVPTPSTSKQYDLIFIGGMPGVNNRRQILLDYLKTRYRVFPDTTELWYEKKAEALANSKICLNIHCDESRYMESMRLCDYFSNHCFVLSEPMHHTEPYIEGKDYIEFFWTNLNEKIDYYLEHEKERDIIADSAFNKLHEHTMMESTRVLLENLIMVSFNRFQSKINKDNNSLMVHTKRIVKKIIQRD